MNTLVKIEAAEYGLEETKAQEIFERMTKRIPSLLKGKNDPVFHGDFETFIVNDKGISKFLAN